MIDIMVGIIYERIIYSFVCGIIIIWYFNGNFIVVN